MAWKARWRAVATVVLPIYFVTSSVPYSAWAATTDSNNHPQPVLTPKNVHVNKHKPRITPYAGVQLPSQPTDYDITFSHAFAEPLQPVGGITTPAEDQALGVAITTFLKRASDEDVSALMNFLNQYPNSAWRPSLDLNLAETYFKNGYFSDALNAWQDAWDRTQNLTDTTGQQVANLAVAKLAKMKARIGRTDELVALFQQIKGRNVTGQAAQLLVEARSGLWLMQNRPQDAFRCGPSALQEISLETKGKIAHPELIKQSQSTPQGVALSDLKTLAGWMDMPMQMAKRTAGSSFMVPAVIHWKLGHYAALVGQRDGKYEVHDTTFGGMEFLISTQALEQETSGYFLVPAGNLPQGWTSVSDQEGYLVFGRGNTGSSDPNAFGADASPSGGNGNNGGDCGGSGNAGGDWGGDGGYTSGSYNNGGDWTGGDGDGPDPSEETAMTQSSVKAMLVSLTLQDTPVRYTPPLGPRMHFKVEYNQRDNTQPTTFSYGNFGPGWTYNYLSYITPGSSTSTVYERGGGVETFYYNSGTSSWYPSQMTQEVLSQVNSTTWQRALPSGEIETYGQPDGSGRFFLTQITDPQGNALTLSYDSNFRLSYMTDALGQVTNITYESNTTTNLPAFYQIAKVTDPFGRYAQFAYNASGQLQSITDIIGITSQFTYATNGFVTSLTTPYGLTGFAYGDIGNDSSLGTTRWMNVTYPDGNTTRTEYRQGAPGISNYDAQGIPTGMYPSISAINDYMEYRNTYFWDKQAMKDHPGEYAYAKITHWLHTSDINTTSDIEESHKSVDQNRIWFGYTGELVSYQASSTMLALPTQKGRIMDDGSTQLFTYAYNALGKVTQQIDPLGRETDYTYASNNIDLLTVKQKTGTSTYDLLATYTYNSQHEVLTMTDASDQTTTNTYYTNGELHTITNAKGQVTTYAYNSSGYLTSVTGPMSGSTVSFTCDSYGRVATVTDSQGYVTTTNYDAMDRPTLITYPDSTTSQISYQNLDAQFTKDRLGRWTHIFYNSIRQPISVMDALGNVTTSIYTLSAGLGSIIDPSGHVTTWQHDGQNRVTEKDYPDGHSEHITYENTTSRVKSATDANGSVATNTYNVDNTVASVSTSAGSGVVATPTVSYTYDAIYPRVHTMTDGVGTTTSSYNGVYVSGAAITGGGRLGSVSVPVAGTTATLAYTYDELGRQLSQSVDSTASSVTYDTLGRVATATNALSGTAFSYTYLANTGRVSSVTNPNGQSTVYTYQDSSSTGEPRLSEIKNLNSSSAVISKFDYGYDAQGQITSWTQQTDSNDPQQWAMQYDNGGRLLGVNITDTTTSALLHQYAYAYDPAGNRTTEQIDGNVTSSSYNNLNQLTGQSPGGAMIFSGTVSKYSTITVGGNPASLDASNNFRGAATVTTGTNDVPIIATDVDGNVATNTYQVVVPSGSSPSYTYDYNGNLLTDGVRTFSWDAKNELISIAYSAGAYSGTHTEFTYNGAGARVKIVERTGTTLGSGTVTSTKWYIANEERDNSNTVLKRYFSQGEQRIVSGTPTSYFYTRDHLGSIREMIDGSGTIQARYSYDPYGRRTKVSGSLDCDFGFTGYYYHATSGLDLSATRPYDPNLGRFIQRDPLAEAAGLNMYAYCGGNPVNLSDPSGLDPLLPDALSQLSGGGGSCMDAPPGNAFDPTDFSLNNMPSTNPDFDPSDLSLNNMPSDDSGFEDASNMLNASGLASTAMDLSGLKIGDNLGLYTSEFARGNQYYSIAADLGKVGKALGPAGYIAGSVVDGVGVYNGQVSPGKAVMNATMGAVGFFPPEGTIVSSAYFGSQLLPPQALGAPMGYAPALPAGTNIPYPPMGGY